MDARRVFAEGADGGFERVVCGAVLDERVELEGIGADVLVGQLSEAGRRVVVLRGGSEAAFDPRRYTGGGERVEVLWVGGERADAQLLARTLADAVGPHEHGWLVTDEREVVPLGPTPQDGPALLLLTDRPPDWPRFWPTIAAKQQGPPPEVRAFVQALAERTPRVTVALAVVILAVYGLGMAFGAPDLPPALLRMGALQRDRVLDGEVWRLVSSNFLHGGVLHLAANTYVLWALGRQLERILGSARYLVLYALSGIGGSLLSMAFLGGGASVGASGAIWGLMTAMLVLSLQRGVLPEDYRVRLRSGLFQTVLINVAISFVPGIDWAGHAGGGLMGALLVATGLLTKGLPRWAGPDPGKDVVPLWVRLGAPLAAVVMAASLLAAVGFGKPWALTAPPVLAPATLRGLSLDAPVGLRGDADADGIFFGNLARDIAQATVSVTPEAPGSEGARAIQVQQLEERLARGEEDLTPRSPVRRETVGDTLVLTASYGFGGGRFSRAVAVRDDVVIWVDVAAWEQAAPEWDDVARRMASSARPVQK